MAIVVDLALFGADGFGTGGFGLAALFSAVPTLLFVARSRWRRSPRLTGIVALLGLVAVRSAIHPTALTTVAGFALLVPFVAAVRGRRLFVVDAALSSFASLGKLPTRLWAAWRGAAAIAPRSRLGVAAIVPLLVPLALSVLFVGIFSLANPVLGSWVAAGLQALVRLEPPPFGRLFTAVIALASAITLLRPALRLPRGSERAECTSEASDASLALARNVLVSLNLVFAAHHALDAAYLWSGRAPAGMTTQAYAHAGALWLTVALALLTLVVGILFRGSLAHDARAGSVRALAHAWIFQGLLLAAGTYRRIGIHIAHTGLSNLRIVGVLGTTLVVIGVILVAVKLERRRSFTWIVRRQLDAFALVFVLFAAAPTHWIAAQVNVSRVLDGEAGPLLHLGPQSREAESVVALVPLLQHPDPRVRQGVAALLGEARERLRRQLGREVGWRRRDLLRTRTLLALDASENEIASALGGVEPAVARMGLARLADDAAHDRTGSATKAM